MTRTIASFCNCGTQHAARCPVHLRLQIKERICTERNIISFVPEDVEEEIDRLLEEELNSPILDDVLKMIEALQRDAKFGPYLSYIPDSGILAMGGDPNDYPELEGYPGVRVVRWTDNRLPKEKKS